MDRMDAIRWHMPLAAWAEWTADAVTPALDFVEPMLRRRLSPLAKASLWVAHQCAADLQELRMVYASQHGEITRTTAMLEEITQEQPVSPTAFSMSVLNASVGLYSILRGNTAPATAIAAGPATLAYALLEAHAQLNRTPDQPVLVIYADETVPAIWQSGEDHSPHALAMLFRADAKTRLICRQRASQAMPPNDKQTQAQVLARCLGAGPDEQPVHWADTHHDWQWQLQAC